MYNNLLLQINPYIRLADNIPIPVGTVIGPRELFDYEIIYALKGCGKIYFNDGEFYICRGDIVFIRPGERHTITTENEILSQPHIHFDITEDENSSIIPISFILRDDMTDLQKTFIRDDVLSYIPIPHIISGKSTGAIPLLIQSMIELCRKKAKYYELN